MTAEALQMAAGIGSGLTTNRYYQYGYNNTCSRCGNISITGGTVEAKGGTGNNNFENLSFEGGAGIGTGSGKTASGYMRSSCGAITIGSGVTSVTATKGNNATNSIGKNHINNPGSCGTVTIGGTLYWNGSEYRNGGDNADTGLPHSPYTYPQP